MWNRNWNKFRKRWDIYHGRLKNYFFKALKAGKLIASNNIVKQGKRLGHIECEVVNDEGKLVVKAKSTCTVQKIGA